MVKEHDIEKDKFYKYALTLCIVLIMFLVCVATRQCSNIKDYKQNQVALSDSIEWVKNKNKDLEAQKAVLVADKKELKKLNEDLYSELQKEKGKIIYINKTGTTIVHDTTYVYSEVSSDGSFRVGIDTTYSEGNYRKLAIDGHYKDSSVSCDIVQDEFGVALVTGLKREDGIVKIFVRSDYPGFNVTELDGAIVDQDDPLLSRDIKKKKFIIGPQVGVGVGAGLKVSPYIGVGATYKIIAF